MRRIFSALLFAVLLLPASAGLITIAGGRGAAPAPGGGGAIEDTVVGMLAATMSPGDWLDITDDVNFDISFARPNLVVTGESSTFEFSDRMVFDAVNLMAYIFGCARGDVGSNDPAYSCNGGGDAGASAEESGAPFYDFVANEWDKDTSHPASTNPHGYDHTTIKDSTGQVFVWESIACGNGSCRIETRTGPPGTSWGTPIANPGAGTGANQALAETGALAYLPLADALIYIDGGNDNNRPTGGSTFYPKVLVRPFNTGVWTGTTITTTVAEMIGYATAFSLYSPQHAMLFFGGGDAVMSGVGPRKFYTYADPSGTITQREDAPVGLTLGPLGANGKHAIDPCTGDLLVFDNTPKDVWRYSPTTDDWTNEDTHLLGTSGSNEMMAVFATITPLDVIMVANYHGGGQVYLYKPETC